MSKSVFKILKSLADNITNKGYGIEGLELSYVDIKERHLEIFTYSSDAYKKAFEEGFVKIGSLLFCDDTFKKSGVIIKDSKFRVISDNHASNEAHLPLVFSHFENPFSNENIGTKPTYSKWITHYRKSNLTGVFFFFGKRKISDFDLVLFGVVDGQDKKQLKKDVRNLLNKFTNELDDFSMVFERLRESRKDIIEQATRAAISQVMARNTSHNIGAHVMNKLIGDLNYDTLFKKKNYNSVELITLYTETIKKWNQDRLKDSKPELTEEEQKQKILLDQISIFNNYVKCRMDYLADISFGTPLMQTNKYAYADLFKELDKVRLLLEHISGLDNFEFEIKFTRNGKEFKKDNQGEGEDDLLVAIPNDILGTQAFYNILENIIRNSAKHAQKPTETDKNGNSIKKTTVFTVNFIDNVKKVDGYCNDEKCDRTQCDKAHKNEIENALNEFIVVEVYDDIPVDSTVKSISLEKKEIDEFKSMMGNVEPKFETYIDYLVFKQNNKLNEDILQKNKLRSYSLGLVEMDASAAYLRKRPVEFINHRSYDIQYDESWSRNTEKNKEEGRDQVTHRGTNCRHFLKAFKKEVKKDDGKTESYLGYRFFLHRPAVVLVVTELLEDKKDETAEKKKENKDKKDTLRKAGIWVIGKTEFGRELKEGKVYPNEFVVYSTENKKTIEQILNDHKTSLSIRMLCIEAKSINDLIANSLIQRQKTVDVWEEYCWKEWIKRMGLENGVINTSVDCSQSIDGVFRGVLIDHKKEDWLEYENCERANFVEVLTSKALERLPKLPPFDSEISEPIKKYVANLFRFKTQKYKVVESSFSTIVVIDERIQTFAEKEFINDKSYFEYLYSMRIFLPRTPDDDKKSFEAASNPRESKFNLSANNMDKNFANGLLDYISYYSKTLKSSDFILIHYSILERLFIDEKDKLVAINDFIDKLPNNFQLVITTGRGIVSGLTSKARFVNLSPVITSFIEINNKHLINYVLNSTRKIQ